MKNDNWFKVLIVIFAAVFLFMFYSQSENKRYHFSRSENDICIEDSHTGIIYGISNGKYYKFDLLSGEMTVRPLRKKELK